MSDLLTSAENNDSSEVDHRFKVIDELALLNKDIVGWITIPNTTIDYPLLQSHNNDYYLKRNVYTEASKYGSIFFDYRNDLTLLDPLQHLILYGHNMKDSQMFGDLNLFKDLSFYETNKVFTILLNQMLYTFEIFSVYQTSIEDDYLISTFNSYEEKNDYLHTRQQKSMYPAHITTNKDDLLLTLSTCTNEFNDMRLVVHAKLIKNNEKGAY